MAARPSSTLQIGLLNEGHDRSVFTCGVESLDRYLKTQAGQDVRRKANAVFVLAERADPATVFGYYILGATALVPGEIPEAARKHLPRYPLVSATLIGRLAVATLRQGQKLGAILLADALRRAADTAGTVGSSMPWTRPAPASRRPRVCEAAGSPRLVLPMRLAGGATEG